ncbi:16S rRNA (adenine(1518)-N(6)/adenine(1519)-N(6))-dimethyltransferase RsmA [Desulfovibrio cuneatus]|uniref:16S rRNA (adenine(1518)-N(6)/adenine(1519)-N(6))- dimethyltransferase RsmA n=1 Tax=Desulfovibrio cuneatus TaxID=159728 RepID=UPI00040E0F0A|nr:16S rRNA (adenine(1518)-N(6)/adenine(1519)-N(6))-dimethyltransferase RsmA [Desulfovibrio cuneatus]
MSVGNGKAGMLPKAKKALGQNFLQDKNIAAKIVRTLHIAPQDAVLEIGPGPGALTGWVMQASPARLVLVEKDNALAFTRMQAERGDFTGKLQVVLADALTMPWNQFTSPWKFVGNLPYNVASPLMWDIVSQASGLERAVFMVQKEVAQRIVAHPETGAYGALSVWLQSFCRAKLEFVVPPQVFVPRPKVDSAVVSFVPHPAGTYSFCPVSLAKTIKICFQMRRKQLGTILRLSGLNAGVLELLGISPQLRPEALPVATFHLLASALFARK